MEKISKISKSKLQQSSPILDVQDLSVAFEQYTEGLRQRSLRVISSLNVSIQEGEILAVVGASGSGKSLLAHAILGILPNNAHVDGAMYYAGRELTARRQAKLRGKEIALIPQSVSYLDPLMRVGAQVRTAVRKGKAASLQREIFERYHLPPHVERYYPHQLSGGMARRVLVAAALISGAKLIIADEPTTGLDSEIIEETCKHFREQANEGCGILLITHDIEMALKIADRIAVFYAGTTVEIAPVQDFSGKGEALRHPYSKALWRALPQNEFSPIPGSQPQPTALPPGGCLFAPRCSFATGECASGLPEARQLREGMVRCIHAS